MTFPSSPVWNSCLLKHPFLLCSTTEHRHFAVAATHESTVQLTSPCLCLPLLIVAFRGNILAQVSEQPVTEEQGTRQCWPKRLFSPICRVVCMATRSAVMHYIGAVMGMGVFR